MNINGLSGCLAPSLYMLSKAYNNLLQPCNFGGSILLVMAGVMAHVPRIGLF